MSLNKDWISQHSVILDTLVENQRKINATLETILENNAYGKNSLVKYAKVAQLFVIFRENVEDLRQELIRIEDCLALIRVSSTHHWRKIYFRFRVKRVLRYNSTKLSLHKKADTYYISVSYSSRRHL